MWFPLLVQVCTAQSYHMWTEIETAVTSCASVNIWVAVKECKLSYYIEDILLVTIYTRHGSLT